MADRSHAYLMKHRYHEKTEKSVPFEPRVGQSLSQYKAFQIPVQDTQDESVTNTCNICRVNDANTRLECEHEMCAKCTKTLFRKGHFESIMCPFCKHLCRSCQQK